jgi:hypothetical protein
VIVVVVPLAKHAANPSKMVCAAGAVSRQVSVPVRQKISIFCEGNILIRS